MPYGSSPYVNRKFIGITGPTGSTGPIGPTGEQGSRGNVGNTGNTGSDLIGITFNDGVLRSEFSNGSVIFAETQISGIAGNYYLFADANSLGTEFSLVDGLTYETINDGNLKPILTFRGFTTASRNENISFISINSNQDANTIGITYNLTGLPYLGISGGNSGQLVVAKSTTEFYGLTGTQYDSLKRTVDAQVLNYGERVKFVNPTKKLIPNSQSEYYYWNIDWEEANIFILNSFSSQLEAGIDVVAQIVNLENPPTTEFAKSLTVIAPSGVTSGVRTDANGNTILEFVTRFSSADNIVNGFTLGEGRYNVSWPMKYQPCFTNDLDVINLLYIDGVWYGNYGIIENNSTQVEWNQSYFNCSPQINAPVINDGGDEEEPPPVYVNCCDTANAVCTTTEYTAETCKSAGYLPVETCDICNGYAIVDCCDTTNGSCIQKTASECAASGHEQLNCNECSQYAIVDCCNTSSGNCTQKQAVECKGIEQIINCQDCEGLDEVGLCCISCNQGESFVGTRQQCLSIPDAQFFEGESIDYSGCDNSTDPLGVCCYFDGERVISELDENRQCDCARLANGLWFKWIPIDSCVLNVNYVNCQNAYDFIGACCDGKGNCSETTPINCQNNGNYYQGDGIKCGDGISVNEVCKTGNGGCCDGAFPIANCTNENGIENCSDTNDKFYGCGYLCSQTNCDPIEPPSTNHPCVIYDNTNPQDPKFIVQKYNSSTGIPEGTIELRVGDEFAGGIVVGMFNPNSSECLGYPYHGFDQYNELVANTPSITDAQKAAALCGSPFKNHEGSQTTVAAYPNMQGVTYGASAYSDGPAPSIFNSSFDEGGYGFAVDELNNNKDQDIYLMIVSRYPVMYRKRAFTDNSFFQTPSGGVSLPNSRFSVDILSSTSPSQLTYQSGAYNYIPYEPFVHDGYAGSVFGGENFLFSYTTTFAWHNGGTAFAPTFPDNGISYIPASPNTTCAITGNNIYDDGAYGASIVAPSYYYDGNTRTFVNCETDPACTLACSSSPLERSNSSNQRYCRSTGRWSLNWGLMNSARLSSAAIVESFFPKTPTLGNFGFDGPFRNIYQYYGPTARSNYPRQETIGLSSYGGFMIDTSGQFPTTRRRSTISDALSVFNRLYYPVDNPGDFNNNNIKSTWSYNPGAGQLTFNAGFTYDTTMQGLGFPQVSRWYVPSIVELAFLANQVKNNNLNAHIVRQGSNGLPGIGIGKAPQGINISNPPTNQQPTTNTTPSYWVWSSTGAFDTLDTTQFIQQFPAYVGDSGVYDVNKITNRFTLAWAMQFAANPITDNYRIAKKSNTDFYAEVRPIRIIRCDQQYYNNTDPAALRNRTWFVPRLPISAVINGTTNPASGSPPSYFANSQSTSDIQAVPTLYKNKTDIPRITP